MDEVGDAEVGSGEGSSELVGSGSSELVGVGTGSSEVGVGSGVGEGSSEVGSGADSVELGTSEEETSAEDEASAEVGSVDAVEVGEAKTSDEET